MYAKLQNNALQVAQKQVQWEGQTVINPNKDILLALGYLPVQYTDPPTVDDGYYAVPRWTQTDSAIVQEWDVLKDARPMTESEVSRLIIAQQINSLTVDDNTALRMVGFYPAWEADTDYAAGFKVQYGGTLYKCLQAHTSQPDWTPDAAPSLWAKVLIPDPDVIPEWEQPDSTNGYSKGDKVKYNGAVYESLIDNNVWSPDAYPAGWQVVE